MEKSTLTDVVLSQFKKKIYLKLTLKLMVLFFLLFYFTLKSTLADVFLFYILKPILP